MAQVLTFTPPLGLAQKLASPDVGSLEVHVPEGLAMRVANAAMWSEKSPQQFILDMLHAAFPDGKGAA